MQILKLLKCEIGPQNAKALAYGINELPLKEVHLIGNAIGPEGALTLDRECCFKNTNISCNAIGSEGAIGISNILEKRNEKINILVLARNLIDSTGIVALAKGLKCCPNLQFTNFTWNPIGSNGAAALRNGLICCFFLQMSY